MSQDRAKLISIGFGFALNYEFIRHLKYEKYFNCVQQ